jgi:4,5-dihydroxyphthalate decarboxylase
MAKLELTFSCWDYDRTRPILDGTIQPEGIDLNSFILTPAEAFNRNLAHHEFDIAEMSFASYVMLLARGDTSYVSIPAFVSREFRHSCIFVNADAGIEKPEDLKGKRIGQQSWDLTAAVWARAALAHDYGVTRGAASWFVGKQDISASRIAYPNPIAYDLPDNVTRIADGKTLSGMLDAGELDALITARFPVPFTDGSPRVKRLFANPREVEAEYYTRTGIFPIMHTIVIREEVYRAHPFVAHSMYKAFLEAKTLAEGQLYETNALRVMLPWVVDEVERTRALMGEDFWPYGISANRPTLDAWGPYLHEQGLAPRSVKTDEMFVTTTT